MTTTLTQLKSQISDEVSIDQIRSQIFVFPGRSYREGLSQRRNEDLLQVWWCGTHSERLPLQINSEETNQPAVIIIIAKRSF